jgi:hypothetical protein
MSNEAAKTEGSQSLRAPLLATAFIGLLLALGAAGMGGVRACLGVSVGAVLGLANLWVLGWVVSRLTTGAGSRAGWSVLAGLKFAALVAACYLLLRAGVVALGPLAIGYGALPLGIVVGQLAFGRQVREEGCGDA